ncbi:MAG: RhuM family protein, partial [Campylobacterota bacterium]|nr:RhuM family protein [Campylobacterota bacterium]
MSDLIKYNNGEIEIAVSIKNETIWLTQKQIAELFDKDVRTINEHIKAIYKEEELLEKSTIRKFRIVQKEGNREVSRDVSHYNLDVIISIGYRANSKKATKFRQWSTRVLKEYISNGYAINTHKITEQRLLNLETDMQEVKSHIKNSTLEVKQGIFYDGQIFDAYVFINDLIKSAKNDVTIIDNYIDESVLTILSKHPNINFIIWTKSISKKLKLDIEKYNTQYKNLQIKISNKHHDRFLIIDDTIAYHIGASLKDLAKKVFAFSKMDIEVLNIIG